MFTLNAALLAAQEALAGIAQGVGWKFIFTVPPVLFYGAEFGGDPHIIIAYCFTFLLDLAIGTASAVKRQVFDFRRLSLWVVKAIVHALCIILIALLDLAFVHALHGFHLPILDIIVSIMLVGEVVSILANLQEMTGRVPPFLMKATAKLHHKASRRFEAMIDAGDEDERPEGKNDQV